MKPLIMAMLLIPGISGAQTSSNKEIVRKLYEEALNKRNFTLLKNFISEDYPGGLAGFEAPVKAVISALPDAQWNIEELIAEGNKVVVKWTLQGTQTGQFQDIRPTGRKVSNTGIGMYEFKNGKVVAVQVHTDRLGFLQQLGVSPLRSGVVFIDKFMVPAEAKEEFYARVRINRGFIRTLPGFIADDAYEQMDEKGNVQFVTIAHWESPAALDSARNAVQAFYREQGFDMPGMLKRLHITMDRGLYTALKD